jgi:hypothetical protein
MLAEFPLPTGLARPLGRGRRLAGGAGGWGAPLLRARASQSGGVSGAGRLGTDRRGRGETERDPSVQAGEEWEGTQAAQTPARVGEEAQVDRDAPPSFPEAVRSAGSGPCGAIGLAQGGLGPRAVSKNTGAHLCVCVCVLGEERGGL